MSNVVNEIDRMVSELKEEGEGYEVWAFIATYDETGRLDWKAFATSDTDEDHTLGSEIVKFDSVRD